MMNEEPADGENGNEADHGEGDVPAWEMLPEEQVDSGSEKPESAEGMREEHEREEREGGKLEPGASGPNEGKTEAGQRDGQIEVHEAHVEDVAVREHGEEWREEPGRAAGSHGDQSEDAPEEEENTEGDRDFFSGRDAKAIGERQQQQIEEDVLPLPDRINARGSSLLDELGEPSVVDMATEITGFDVAVPEDGNEKKGGKEDGAESHCDGESIARVRNGEEVEE